MPWAPSGGALAESSGAHVGSLWGQEASDDRKRTLKLQLNLMTSASLQRKLDGGSGDRVLKHAWAGNRFDRSGGDAFIGSKYFL